jgi:hypothetical protein
VPRTSDEERIVYSINDVVKAGYPQAENDTGCLLTSYMKSQLN